jgi:endonuclease/exonuclease/phosphatase (EEP) superfamily protein YafD
MTTVLSAFSFLMTVSVFITFVRNDYWMFKIMEYPRLQKLVVVLATLVLWLASFPLGQISEVISMALLGLAAVYLFYKILPYTRLSSKEMKEVAATGDAPILKIYAANVYQDNTEYHRVLEQVKTTSPDLVFLLETDCKWAEGMAELHSTYPFSLKCPLDNTYGLLFYSRFPLKDAKINYLVKPDIPSIEAIVSLPSGDEVKLFGLHPEPPVPTENLYSTAKDKELMKVALAVKDCKLPCIVFGDLNDVAWSHTTELFRKTSRLLDPRRGRGFYSTFSAHSRLIRFPLDYVFCSPQFGLVEMKRMPKNGSDHFATFTCLALMKDLQQEQETPKADADELEEAQEISQKAVNE